MEEITSMLVGTDVTSEVFPSDNQDATITMVGDVSDLQIDVGESGMVGTNTVGVPFSCEVEGCFSDLFIPKWEYFTSQDKRFSLFDDDWNSYYVLAESDINLAFEGSFLIKLKESADRSNVEIESIEIVHVDEPQVTWPKARD